jgi:hypothetical protein
MLRHTYIACLVISFNIRLDKQLMYKRSTEARLRNFFAVENNKY